MLCAQATEKLSAGAVLDSILERNKTVLQSADDVSQLDGDDAMVTLPGFNKPSGAHNKSADGCVELE